MNDIQIQTLAKVQKKIESLLEDNKKFKIIIYGTESGTISADVVESID